MQSSITVYVYSIAVAINICKVVVRNLLRLNQMRSISYVISSIAFETQLYESMSTEELTKRTNASLSMISKFEKGEIKPNSLELGSACCLLISLSEEYANHQHWKTIERLYAGVKPESVKVEVLSLRDDYIKDKVKS